MADAPLLLDASCSAPHPANWNWALAASCGRRCGRRLAVSGAIGIIARTLSLRVALIVGALVSGLPMVLLILAVNFRDLVIYLLATAAPEGAYSLLYVGGLQVISTAAPERNRGGILSRYACTRHDAIHHITFHRSFGTTPSRRSRPAGRLPWARGRGFLRSAALCAHRAHHGCGHDQATSKDPLTALSSIRPAYALDRGSRKAAWLVSWLKWVSGAVSEESEEERRLAA